MNTIRKWIVIVLLLLFVLALAAWKGALGSPTIAFPQTATEAAQMFGSAGTRSADAAQYDVCDNPQPAQPVWCWHLASGVPVTVTIPLGAKLEGWAGGLVHAVGPATVLVEEASIREDPEALDEVVYLPLVLRDDGGKTTPIGFPTGKPPQPTPTATPQPTPTEELLNFPQSAEIAAQTFGVTGQRSAQVSQWSPCDNQTEPGQIYCWHMPNGELTLVSVPAGMWAQVWASGNDGTIPPLDMEVEGLWEGTVGTVTIRPRWN